MIAFHHCNKYPKLTTFAEKRVTWFRDSVHCRSTLGPETEQHSGERLVEKEDAHIMAAKHQNERKRRSRTLSIPLESMPP